MSTPGTPASQPKEQVPSPKENLEGEQFFRQALATAPDPTAYVDWLKALEKLTPTEKEQAIASVEKMVSASTDQASALANWGAALSQLEKYDESQAKFQQAVAIDPEGADPYLVWGKALFDQRRFADAEEKFRQAIVLGPDSADYEDWLVTLENLSQSDRDKATAALSQAIDKAGSAAAYVAWGGALAERERYPDAIEKYQRASKLAPDDADAYEAWGSALLRQHRFDEAQALLQRAIACGPVRYSSAYSDWLTVLDRLSPKERDEASKSLEQAIADRPNRADILVNLANALALERRPEQAIATYEKAAAIDPEKNPFLATGYVDWGRVLASQRQHKEAIEKYRHAAHVSPKTAGDAYFHWSKSLAILQQYGEAGRKCKDSLQVDPNQAVVYEQWGQILYLQNEFEEATAKFQKAIELEDSVGLFRQWLHNLARVSKDAQGRFALQLSTALDSKDPKRQGANAYVSWGQALSERGTFDDAIKKYQRALELDPKFPAACLAWGDTLLAQKKYVGAVEQYQRAKALGQSDKDVQFKLAIVLLAQGAYQKCLDVLAPFKAESHSAGQVSEALGDCYYGLGRFEEAETQYRQALATLTTSYPHFLKWRSTLYSLPSAVQDQAIESLAKVVNGNVSWPARINWGVILTTLEKPDEALEQFDLVLADYPYLSNAYFQRGNVLADQRRYHEAQAEFQKAINTDQAFPYAYHNIAYFLKKLGKYTEARVAWDDTRRSYDLSLPRAIAEGDVYPFYYYGAVLRDVFGEFDEAECILREGLELNPEHVESLIYLGQNALNQAAEGDSDTAFAEAAAYEYFRRAEQMLRKRREEGPTWALMGDLFLKMKRYPEAEKYLRKAGEADSTIPIQTQLGVLFAQQKKFDLAVQCFEQAVREDPDDLDARSNLAEALFNLPALDRAQDEYEKILAITREQIDTRIGLGQLFTKLGDDGDVDMYDVAICHLAEAVRLAETRTGSKRLSRPDLAATHYSLGYARVRLYEKAKTFADEGQLSDALDDFRECVRLDGSHHKARRAMEKLTKRTKLLSPQSQIEKLGPWFIFVAAVFVFLSTQLGYWFRQPAWLNHSIDATLYSAMTLSSLTLAIVGFYLPRILKLKVAGIEIEKSSVEQISTISQPLDIGK